MKKHVLVLVIFCSAIVSAIAQTTITLQPNAAAGKDAELFNCVPCGYANKNYGNKKDLNAMAWTNNGDISNIRSLIQFDLSAVPPGATITDARLSLYHNPSSLEGHHVSSFFHPNSSYLQRITASWTESTVTWNNQPATTTLHRVSLSATSSSTQSFTNINVTTLVQDMVDNPASSFGFMLRLQTEKKFKKLIFASSDHTTASLRPKLVITYTTLAPRLAENENYNEALRIDLSLNPALVYTLSPNPAKESVEMNIHSGKNVAAQILVFDMSGKKVFSESVQLSEGKNNIRMQTAAWGKGIYLATVKTSGEVITKKLFVE